MFKWLFLCLKWFMEEGKNIVKIKKTGQPDTQTGVLYLSVCWSVFICLSLPIKAPRPELPCQTVVKALQNVREKACPGSTDVPLGDISSSSHLGHPWAMFVPRPDLSDWRWGALRECPGGREASLWRPLGYWGRHCGLQEPRTRQGDQLHHQGFLWPAGQ